MPARRRRSTKGHMFKFDRKTETALVYLIPIAVAIFARVILFSSWLKSPFRYYHEISGLDMKTVLSFVDSFGRGCSEFSIYKLFALLCLKSGGGVPAIILGQMILGIATVFLITFISRRILRNNIAAMISGILAALYAPALMYESVTLIESVFVFISTLSLAILVLQTKKPRYGTLLFIAGAAATLPSLVRFTGVFWTLFAICWLILSNFRKARRNGGTNTFKCIYLPLAGVAVVLISVSIFNLMTISSLNPLPALPRSAYAIQTGVEMNFTGVPRTTWHAPLSIGNITSRAVNYAEKFICLFKGFEIPDNLNYYFVREFLIPLKQLPGPLLLVPFAILGMILILYRRRLRGLSILMFIYLVSYAIPCTAYIPLGRYRLILLPVFCVFAGYAIVFTIVSLLHFRKRLLALLVIAVGYSILFTFAGPKTIPLRAEDFVAYGNAMEISGKYDSGEISTAYKIAHNINPDSISAAIHLANNHMKNAEFSEAEKALRDIYVSNPLNPTIAISYASSLLGSGKAEKAEKAEKILMGITEPDSRPSKVNYYYQLGESRRMQERKTEALLCYKLALHYSDSDSQKKLIGMAMDRVK